MKIIALLTALAALWVFAAVVTVRDGLNVLYVSTVDREVGRPTNFLVGALQQERRLSVVAVNGGAELRAQLDTIRAGTDAMLATWRDSVGGNSLRVAASDRLKERIADAGQELGELAELRAAIDDGTADRAEVQAGYTAMIESGFAIYAAVSVIDDQEIAGQARTLVTLTRAREVLSQQDALIAGALVEGGFTERDLTELIELVGTQRFLYDNVATQLAPEDLAAYQEVINSPAMQELRDAEDTLIELTRPGTPPPLSPVDWQETIEPAMASILGMEIASADRTLADANAARTGVIIRLVLAGGLGLIAVIAAIIVSITTARTLVRQLERLRDAAWDLARNRLPRVVERLSTGEKVDVSTDAPPLRFGNDEIGQVGQAFNAVQETAVRAAVQQAELRHGVRDVFLSLARRTQNLVHKQLGVVDAMERRETDADEMEDLYRIDHLATRMRRNAENLIVLSGATPGRVWRRPVPMVDVVRGAIAEVEDYRRVNLLSVQSGAVEGRVAGDVIHLLAELIENAASFSPPYAMVSVSGERVAHGFAVEVEDRGLGMSEGDLAAANRKLSDPPDFSLADTSQLGHYVVAKLAQRHGVRVHLKVSPYGGITAIVLVPREIMTEPVEDGSADQPAVPAGVPVNGSGPADGTDGFGGSTESGSSAVTVRQRGQTSAPPAAPGSPGGSAPPAGPDPAADPVGPASGAAAGPVPMAPPPTVEFPPLYPPAYPPGPASGSPSAPFPPPTRSGGGSRHAAPPPPTTSPRRSGPPATGSPRHEPGRTPQPYREPEGAERTPSGLPWRVRQASLPRQLWNDESAAEELPARDPEQVRQSMRSYQIGTQRGRGDTSDSLPTPTEHHDHQPPGERPGDRQEG